MKLDRLKSYAFVWIDSINWLYMRNVSKFPSRRVRLFLLRKAGATIEDKVSIFAYVEYRHPSGLTIRHGCSIGPRVVLDARRGLEIGRNVTIAAESMIWTLHHDYNDTNFTAIGDTVRIGDFAWICSRAIILPGITIGEGAVVSSGAVVTKDVEPWSIVGGVPAKKIGEREQKVYTYTPCYKLHIV